MTTARSLTGVLDDEIAVLGQLLDVLQADQERIVRHDVEGLEASNRSKEGIVLRFQALEQMRGQLTLQIGRELGIPPDEVRVSRIAPLLGGDGARLRDSAAKLRALVTSLGELISVSRGFLEQSIMGVRSLLSLIQSLRAPEPAGYDALGRHSERPDPGALAVRREA